MKVLQKKTELCTCCMTKHEVKKVRYKDSTVFKGVSVNYDCTSYYCDKADEYFVDEDMMTANDIAIKDAYRQSCDLLTSEQIIEIRKQYDISQSDMCDLLGWGGKTIARYETHQVQDKAHDSILRKLRDDPEWFLHLLACSERLSAFAINKYQTAAERLYETDYDEYLKKAIKAQYVKYYIHFEYSGYTPLNIAKIVDLVNYYASSPDVTKLYKVKLMKMLWYADALSYKTFGQTITGLVYEALPMGAVPVAHRDIMNLSGIHYEEIEIGDGTAYRFIPNGNADYPNLSEEEIKIADKIIKKFGHATKDRIVNCMHKEKAYTETKAGEPISFEWARELSLTI